MKSLLAALGLPAGSAGLAYAVLQWMPSLIWCIPLVCALAVLAYVWFEWHVEVVPRFKTRVEELTGGRLSENLRRRLDAALHGGAAPQGMGERALRGADALLATIWGDSTWDKPALERALLVAFLYPLALLMVVWAISGVGTLGNAVVLPPDWAFPKRLLWSLALLGVPWLAYLATKRVLRRKVSEVGARLVLMAAVSFVPFALALNLAFAAAVAGSGAFAGAGVVAVAFAVAVAVASAVAVAFAFAFAVASAFAVAVAFVASVVLGFAGAGAGAGVVALSVSVALGFAGAVAALLPLDWLVERLRIWGYPVVGIALLWWAGLFAYLLTAAAWLPAWLPAAQLHVNGQMFVLIVFLNLLPLLNAVSDWVSVGATRAFIRRYLAGKMRVWLLVLLDGLIAVALMLVLYLGVAGLFLALQHWGWQVDARALVATFRDHPLSPQASWLTAMAVTNILPTLLHLSIAVVGLLTGRLHRERASLADAFERLRPSLIALPGIQQAAADGHGLARSDAIAMVNYLYVDRWLGAVLALSLIIALWPVLTFGLAWSLAWL